MGDEKILCNGHERGLSVYPLSTTSDSNQTNIKFGFLDEAGRRVSLKAEDGWSVSGGGWDDQSIPCDCAQSFVTRSFVSGLRKKNGNIMPLREHHTVYLPLTVLTLGSRKDVSKVGVWDTLQ